MANVRTGPANDSNNFPFFVHGMMQLPRDYLIEYNIAQSAVIYRESIYRADQGGEFHLVGWWESVVYITSSRRTVRLGYRCRGYMRDSLVKS